MGNKTVLGSIALGAVVIFGSMAYATAHKPKAPPATPPAPEMTTGAQFNSAQKAQIEAIIQDYLLQNPEILIKVSDKLRAKQAQMMEQRVVSSITANRKALLDAKDPILGNKTAPISVVEFFDYQCGHCKRVSPTLDSIVTNNEDVRVVLKIFPIFGESSMFAAKAALASQKQGKFKALHKALLKAPGRLNKSVVLKIAEAAGLDATKLQKDMNSPEIKAELDANRMLAMKLGVRGTPAFVITKTDLNSKAKPAFIPGAASQARLQAEIDKQLAMKVDVPQTTSGPAPGRPALEQKVEPAEREPATKPTSPDEPQQLDPKTRPTPPSTVAPPSPAPGRNPL